MMRKYYVVSTHKNGTIHSWESTCGGFSLFDNVSYDLISDWQKYATDKIGSPCIITNFIRLSLK